MKFLIGVISLKLDIRNQAKGTQKGDREREMLLWMSDVCGDIHHGQLGKHQELDCPSRQEDSEALLPILCSSSSLPSTLKVPGFPSTVDALTLPNSSSDRGLKQI